MERQANNNICDMIHLKVQYIADSDPINQPLLFRMPIRPIVCTFLTNVPLSTQLDMIIKALNAPQSVRGNNTIYKDSFQSQTISSVISSSLLTLDLLY